MGAKFQVYKMEKILETDAGDAAQCECHCALNCALNKG